MPPCSTGSASLDPGGTCMRWDKRGAVRRAFVAALLVGSVAWPACGGRDDGGDEDDGASSGDPDPSSHDRLCVIGYEYDCADPGESWTGSACCIDGASSCDARGESQCSG